jgi:hypothetical protein
MERDNAKRVPWQNLDRTLATNARQPMARPSIVSNRGKDTLKTTKDMPSPTQSQDSSRAIEASIKDTKENLIAVVKETQKILRSGAQDKERRKSLEIIEFLSNGGEGGLPKFLPPNTKKEVLKTIAQKAYEFLGHECPTDLDILVARAFENISQQESLERRNNQRLGLSRAKHIIDNFLKETPLTFREKDGILTIRRLIREAAALIAEVKEGNSRQSNGDASYFIKGIEDLLNTRYPLKPQPPIKITE